MTTERPPGQDPVPENQAESKKNGGEDPIPTGVWTGPGEPITAPDGSSGGHGATVQRADSAADAGDARADRYEYRRVLGKGGMGEVRLYHDRAIGRDVAMKMLRASAASRQPDAASRFEREVKVQGQLEHPSIVPVYDLGTRADGVRYFTMKSVRGQSLRQVLDGLREGGAADTYSLRKLLAAFNAVCLAVDFAHSRGVLHRDLKPSNIMLGDFGEVYVLDWGVAKVQGLADAPARARGQDALVHASMTWDGIVVGTPVYMAPELFGKHTAATDPRSDVYALGAVLFEILTLEPMHEGATMADIERSVTKGPVVKPSVRAPERDIAPELDEICLRATAREPGARYASARELSNALERFLDGDRDLVLRRKIAEERAKEAQEALKRSRAAGADESEERGRAMRAVTASLGLDPENPDALAILMEMVTRPPRNLPAEAEAALHASEQRRNRKAARLALLIYLGFAFYVPFPLWMGLRSTTAFLVLAGCITACALSSWRLIRHPPEDAGVPFLHVIATTLTICAAATMLGPFTLVPMLAFGNMAGYIASTGRKRRWMAILGACAAVLLPWLLQTIGVMPATYELQSGAITILPVMFEFPQVPTTVFLLVTNVSIILTGAFFVSRLRDEFTQAERTLQMQAWQLRQIVPEKARGAVTLPG